MQCLFLFVEAGNSMVLTNYFFSQGHFSSSPIREEPDEKGHHPAMSESELLASPELSPVAGKEVSMS